MNRSFSNLQCASVAKFCVLALIYVSGITVSAQHQTDNWYFGNQSGLNFFGPAPITISSGSLNSSYGSSSISDSAGNLLFYTDGQSVWNMNHALMPNGTGMLGGNATQAALIIPKPGSTTEYYIFTNDHTSGNNGFQYSLVDMTFDSGLGDVTAMNFFLEDELTEKMAATSTRSGDEYWITVHEYGGDYFYTYKITATGIDPNIVISAVGTAHNTSAPTNGMGQMKFSACGNRLAVAIGTQNLVEVFDFDDSSGVISNPVTIQMSDAAFGIEFSPNGNVLYVTTEGSNTLHQYDLSSGIQATIIASHIVLSVTQLDGMQLAKDGKIYIAKNQIKYLACINTPDTIGAACNFVDSIIDLDPNLLGHVSGRCLPEFVSSVFRDSIACTPATTGLTDIYSNEISVFPNPSENGFNISFSDMTILRLFDCQGALLNEIETNKPLAIGENLSNGIYFLQLTNSENSNIIKLIKN